MSYIVINKVQPQVPPVNVEGDIDTGMRERDPEAPEVQIELEPVHFEEVADPTVAGRLDELVRRTLDSKVSTIGEGELDRELAPLREGVRSAIDAIMGDGKLNAAEKMRRSERLVEYEAKINLVLVHRDEAASAMGKFGKLTAGAIASAIRGRLAGVERSAADVETLAVVDAAVETQMLLAEELRDLYNHLPQAGEGLFELIQSCSARASEINQVVMELAEKELPPEEANALAAKLLPAKAAAMHGTAEALALLKRELAPLADGIDQLRDKVSHGGGIATSAEISQLGTKMRLAKEALELAKREGIVYREGEPAFRPEPTVLQAFADLLGEVEGQYRRLAEESLADAVKGLANDVVPDVEKFRIFGDTEHLGKILELSHQRTAAFVETVKRGGEFARNFSHCLVGLAEGKVPRQTVVDYGAFLCADSGMQELRRQMAKLFRMYESLKRYVSGKGFDADDARRAARLGHDRAVLKRVLAELDEVVQKGGFAAFTNLSDLSDPDERTDHVRNRVLAATMRVERMAEQLRVKVDKGQAPNAMLLGVVDGKVGLDTYVGARSWGAQGNLIDEQLDDRNLVGSKVLGAGQANTTMLLTYRTEAGGTVKRVFKPEFPADRSIFQMRLGMNGSYQPLQEVFRLNVAAQKTAELLGTPKAIVKSTVGVHNGQFGLLMELAPGSSLADIHDKRSKSFGGKTIDEINNLSEPDYARFIGNLMHGLNDLMWNDLITGQGDRHWGNYLIAVEDDLSVRVTGIDNDTCFPPWRLGATTFAIDEQNKKRFLEKCMDWGVLSRRPSADTLSRLSFESIAARFNGPLTGQVRADGNRLIVNAHCEGHAHTTSALTIALRDTFGFQKCCRPVAISEEMYNRLEALHADKAAFRAALADQLDAGQLDAAEARLDDAWDLAQKLRAKGKMIRPQHEEGGQMVPDGWSVFSVCQEIIGAMLVAALNYKYTQEPSKADPTKMVTKVVKRNDIAQNIVTTEFFISDIFRQGCGLDKLPKVSGGIV